MALFTKRVFIFNEMLVTLGPNVPGKNRTKELQNALKYKKKKTNLEL